MKSRIVLMIAGVCVLSAGVVAFSRSSSGGASAGSTTLLPKLQASGTSPDGKETFRLQAFEPWSNAGRRVVIVSGASVNSEGMASLSTVRTHDSGLGTGPVSVKGEHYTFTVRPAQGAWTAATADSDLVSEVTANN